MARVPYISRDDLPADKRPLYDHIEQTRGGIDGKGMPNSFRLLLNSPDGAEAVGALGEHIRLRSSLHPAFRETAILGVARALDSQYVWAHHEPIARSVGVRDEVIESIRSGRAPMGLPPKEGVFAQAGKEFVRNGALGERTFQAVEHLLGPEGAVELVVVIGYYTMLNAVLGSLGIELDDHLEATLPIQS
ncbi:MAG: carboxymuconolactone decarboxylase family protein [Chloroflexi bacterium]|nr:carboxymuconolactone decarboxylase family protein [Chloroflexota bacterium]